MINKLEQEKNFNSLSCVIMNRLYHIMIYDYILAIKKPNIVVNLSHLTIR